MDKFTIRRRGKIIGQVKIDGPYPLSGETIAAASAEAHRQAKENTSPTRSQGYRRKRKTKDA
jgi:hypothetical protein